MKRFLALATFVLSFSALADQCQALSPVMAQRAALLLQSGAEIASLCQNCGEVIRDAQVSVARGVRIEGNGNYREVIVGGRGIDLAYTYIKVAPNKFVNIAKVVGCKSSGASLVIRQ